MNRNLLRTLCALVLLLLCLSSRTAATSLLSPASAPLRSGFDLPDNLPAVEAIYPLSEAAKARLRSSGFVVLPDHDVERLSDAYFGLFGEEQVSVFITSDVALHLFHNVFDDLLAEVEKVHLYDDVEWLVQQLHTASTVRYATIPETQEWGKAAARHDVLVFAVARRLLDDSFVPPEYVEPDASQYVQKVLDHTLTEFYPGDDYTQYEPRGQYAGDEQLERYFRAVKWLSRRIFRIEDSHYPYDADVELTAAALLAQLMADDPAIEARWNKVYDVTRLLGGPADSITPPMTKQALDDVFGASFTLDMLEDDANRAALRTEFQRDIYPTSEIIPVPLEFPGQIPPKYVQFLGERYLPDAEAVQETVFPHVPTRTLPSGLDVMATVLASDRAKYWLADDIATYPGLDTQLTALRAQFDAYTEADWTKSIYNGWLYSLRPLLQPMPAGAPAFTQGTAWQDKELNTALGSWTQLRHDFILYGKQTYIPSPWAEGPGLVEPVPDTFDRLANLCDQVHSVLDGYNMLPEVHGRSLGDLATKLGTWRDYAQKVGDGDGLSEEEQGDIHSVGIWLLEFFRDDWGVEEKSPLLVADVASDSNTARVLHEGTAHFNPLIVVYTPPGGEPIAGIGYVFSHYEFAESNWNRLNDAEWADRLQENPPSRPAWASSFLTLDQSEVIYLPLIISMGSATANPPPDGEPNISVSPVSHDFGSVTMGSSSAPQTFTISNTGTAELVIGTITISGTDASEFSIQNDNCSGQSMAPSGSCTVDVVFSPTSAGSKGADLSISSNDPDRPTLDVALIGTGIDDLLAKCEVSDRQFERLEIGDMIVYFHQRMIDNAIVEKDFIVCQFDRVTRELIDKKVHWRSGLPEHVTTYVTKEEAESMARGEVQFTELYIISPDSDVFSLEPTPENPCWVVRSIDNNNTIVTITDAVTGEMLGYGVPPP